MEGFNKTKEKNLNKIEPQHIQTSVNITFKLGNFTHFKAFRSSGVDEFSLIGPCKKLKKKTVEGPFHPGKEFSIEKFFKAEIKLYWLVIFRSTNYCHSSV